MAPFDLNQPINWEEEDEEVVEKYDGTVEDLNYGLPCAVADKEELVDVRHGGVAGQAYGRGGKGAGTDGQGCHITMETLPATGDANGYGAGGGGGLARSDRGLDLSKLSKFL